jgi:hypothetical protein
MIDEDDIDAEALAWGEWLMKPTSPTPEDAQELRMMAKLLGSRTEAERLVSYTRPRRIDPNNVPSNAPPPRPYRRQPPRLEFVYWETVSFRFGVQWRIERFENGRRVHCHDGDDLERRDALLIKLRAHGFKCTPVVVAGVTPTPIRGRYQDRPKKISAKAAMLKHLSDFTASNAKDFSLADYEFEE